jgi:peptidoglycan hydrolase-like protein with peptidoglycan-binding domain
MRRRIAAGGILAVLGTVGALALGQPAGTRAQVASPSPTAAERATAEVERRTLELRDELDGTLGFEGDLTIASAVAGTVTRLPEPGSILKRGQALYELDGARRGIVLYGARPVWRTLSEDVESGSDVRQLEQNLNALKHLAKAEVDGRWDDQTTDAVERFQTKQKLEVDGILEPGDVVFVAEAVRVGDHTAIVGDRVGPGTPLYDGSSTRRTVTVALGVSDLDLVEAEQPVTIELPDGSTVAGTVREIGRVVTEDTSEQGFPTGESGDPTVEVTIDLTEPDAAAAYDAAPVRVEVVREARTDVLAVPVHALVALLEGGYAVEVVGADGSTTLVGVETGLFDGGWVEVRGDLEPGQSVVVPS